MIFLKSGRQLGIHLTNNHIRTVEFDGGARKIINASSYTLPHSLADLKKNKALEGLSTDFTKAWSELKNNGASRRAVLTIGDEEIFIKIITMPHMPLSEARRAAPSELESDLPLKANDMYVDVSLLGQSATSNQMEIMVFAASKSYIDVLTEATEKANLTLEAIEINSFSLGRLYSGQFKTFLTIDLGGSHGAITIFENDLMHVTTSVSFDNPSWSEAIHQNQTDITEENVAQTFGSVVDTVAEKIETVIRYYHNRVENPQTIEKIFLSGSGAQVPHLDKVISDKINLTVDIGRAPITVTAPCTTAHLAAIGAALRDTNHEY